MFDLIQTNIMSVTTAKYSSNLSKLEESICKLELRLGYLNSMVQASFLKSTHHVYSEDFQMFESTSTKNTKKCQPSEGDRQDLIQTWPVPHRGLTRPKIKINRTKKLKMKKVKTSAMLLCPRKSNSQNLSSHK